MLSEDARKDRYLAQTGRREPTARQRRRIAKKAGHQKAQADRLIAATLDAAA